MDNTLQHTFHLQSLPSGPPDRPQEGEGLRERPPPAGGRSGSVQPHELLPQRTRQVEFEEISAERVRTGPRVRDSHRRAEEGHQWHFHEFGKFGAEEDTEGQPLIG